MLLQEWQRQGKGGEQRFDVFWVLQWSSWKKHLKWFSYAVYFWNTVFGIPMFWMKLNPFHGVHNLLSLSRLRDGWIDQSRLRLNKSYDTESIRTKWRPHTIRKRCCKGRLPSWAWLTATVAFPSVLQTLHGAQRLITWFVKTKCCFYFCIARRLASWKWRSFQKPRLHPTSPASNQFLVNILISKSTATKS